MKSTCWLQVTAECTAKQLMVLVVDRISAEIISLYICVYIFIF